MEETGLTSPSVTYHRHPYTATDAVFSTLRKSPYHFVLVHCLAWVTDPNVIAVAGSDLREVRWARLQEVEELAYANRSVSNIVVSRSL